MSDPTGTATTVTAPFTPPKTKGWWGYRLASAFGKICRSWTGDYYRKDGNSPIIRLNHKPQTRKRLTLRQYVRRAKREMAGIQLGYTQPAAPATVTA